MALIAGSSGSRRFGLVRLALANGTHPAATRAEDPVTRIALPALAADGSFPPPPVPPPQPPASTRPAWSGDTLLNVMYRADTPKPVAALTIDDGYTARSEILDVLKSREAHATFFVIGSLLARDPGFVRRALAEGHEFGNHTQDHRDCPTALREGTFTYQVRQPEETLRSIIPGETLKPYFRPPGGGNRRDVVEAAAAEGYRTILWSVDPWDWKYALSPSRVVPQTGPGSIILNHFTANTAANLGAVIDTLREQKGIRFVTLSELVR